MDIIIDYIAKRVLTLSANKPCDTRDVVADYAFKYTFKVICFSIIRKPLRAFIIIHIPNGQTSQDTREMMLHNVNNNQLV